jgi:SWIM zinc finger.
MSRLNAYKKANPTNPFTGNESGLLFDGAIPSSRNPEVQYHVTVSSTSQSCTCPAFSTYYRGKDCSHIKMVKETLNGSMD